MADGSGYQVPWVVAPADGWVAPKGRTPDGRVVAEPSRRLLAYLVDVAIWVVPAMIFVGGAVIVLVASTSAAGEPSGGAIGSIVALYALGVGSAFLRIVVEAELVTRRGQTWGMKAMQLRVVDGRTGGSVSRGKAWGRAAFGLLISSQILYVGYFWAFFDDRSRTLHDLVCNTVVIDER